MVFDSLFGRTDKPLEQSQHDALDIAPYANGLREFITSCQTPMTVGLQGEWGSGKTSLMKLIEGNLKQSKEVVTFWFETWQYGAVGNADMLGLLLLRDLSGRLLSQLKDSDAGFRWRRRFESFVSNTVPAAVAGTITRASGDFVDGSMLIKGGREEHGQSDLREEFGKLVDIALGNEGDEARRRLVVFVDDLDRIQPRLAVRLLEVLKNFMDVQRCVFIVACDKAVVRDGVRELMNIEDDEKVDAFFHKLFQVPFHMPVGAYTIDSLLRNSVRARLQQKNPKKKQKIENFLDSTKEHVQRWFEHLRSLVETAIGTNPRAFKRYLNVIDLTCCVDTAFADSRKAGGKNKENERDALSHWNVGTPNLEKLTIRWLVALFPIVALEQRWPEIAPYLLSDVGRKRRYETTLGSVEHTDFERRLRTITGRWPEGFDDDAVANLYADELLLQQLREAYDADGTEAEEKPVIADLKAFARQWFDLLNSTADQDRLTDFELEVIAKWSSRLGRMGTSQTRPSRIVAFQNTCLENCQRSGDGFASLASHVLHHISSEQLERIKWDIGTEQLSIKLVIGGSNLALFGFIVKNGRLAMKFNATSHYEHKWELPGLAELADHRSHLRPAVAGHVVHCRSPACGELQQTLHPPSEDQPAGFTVRLQVPTYARDCQHDLPTVGLTRQAHALG